MERNVLILLSVGKIGRFLQTWQGKIRAPNNAAEKLQFVSSVLIQAEFSD
jgi:hypothetical protein